MRALEKAELTVEAGRVHAILGENGAGKSTLIKIMAGVVVPDEGRMLLDGREVRFADPAAANAAGIVCIFQELSLIPDLSVADNIIVSNPPQRFGMIDRRAQRRLAEAALARAGGADIHPSALVKDLPLSRRQIVEIAKALARKPRVLILDEATSALTASDVKTVFEVLKRLRAEGIALLYISHRMHEIAELADDCTVFRNGRNVATYAAGTKSDEQVVELMIGREYHNVFPPKPAPQPESVAPVLETRKLSWAPRLNGVSLSVRPGEVVGLGGTRRARAARIAAGAVRGTARHRRRDPGRWRAGVAAFAARGQGRQDRHGADPRGSQDRGADAADGGARQSQFCGDVAVLEGRHHRPGGRAAGRSTR